MILIKHHNGRTTSVSIDGDNLDDYNGKIASATMLDLAVRFPDNLIIWSSDDVFESLDLKRIPQYLENNLNMISYVDEGPRYIPDSIAYIEDTPSVSLNSKVRYPTWLMSSDAGAIYCTSVNAFKNIKPYKNFNFFLNSIAKAGQKNGLLCYSEPRLFKETYLNKKMRTKSGNNFVLFKFVKQHYRYRTTLLLFLNIVVHERKFPLFALLSAFFYSFNRTNQRFNIDLKSNGRSTISDSIDVIVPTIGRAKHLKQVFLDLSIQDLIPRKVIVIEQNENTDSSELSFIDDDWPFQIEHQLINKTGACLARNLALDKVSSSYVFMADDDIRIPSDFMSNALNFIMDFNVKAATFSCLQEGEHDNIPTVLQWNTFGSGCSIVESSAVKLIRFDTAMEHGYGEDKEFGMQIRNTGNDILYNPFIKLLHLKAPIGGFRKETIKPWDKKEIKPKPSPTIMYFKLKHATAKQIKGYKLRLFLKYYTDQKIKNPFKYYTNFKQSWKISVHWANNLNRAI